MTDPIEGNQASSSDTSGGVATGTVEGANGAPSATPNAEGAWFDTLPEGLRGAPSLQTFKGKSIAALAESHVNAEKMIGGSLRLPKDGASPDEVKKSLDGIYGKLGRPESPDKYEFKKPATVEGVNWDDNKAQSFLKTAHEIGLNSRQVQKLIDLQADFERQALPDNAKLFDKCIQTLEQGDDNNPGWGSTTPRYVAIASRAAKTMFTPEVLQKLDRTGLSNDPELVRGLYKIGRELMEDGIIFPDNEDNPVLQGGTQAAQAEINKVMGDPKHAYFDVNHADHETAVQRMLDLRRFVMS